jgi:L-ascorbate metabolism protein UlaG (beta-lactamase superfamily)
MRPKKVAAIAAAAVSAAAIERRFVAAPRYRGPRSDHFDGEHFFNERAGHQGGLAFLKWQMARQPGWWNRYRDLPPGPPPPERVGGGALRLTFVNHSTTLIQFDGVNILTDPIWSERPSPVPFAGPRRHRPPGIRFDDLPPIDLVLVSHNHYDHLDVATLRALQARGAPRIVTALGNARLMGRAGILGARDLDWWQSADVVASGAPHPAPAAPPSPRLRGEGMVVVVVTCVPARHFSARGLSDRDRNLWSGFVVSGPSGNVYFAGDTGWGGHFEAIGARFDPIRLALLPIGSYLPRWFMQPAHIDPQQAVAAHRALGARTSIPVHYGTFALGDDGEDEPVIELRRAMGEERFVILDHGEGADVS